MCYTEMPEDVLVIHAALGEEMVHPNIEQKGVPGIGRKIIFSRRRTARGRMGCSSQFSPTRQGFPSPSLRVVTDFRFGRSLDMSSDRAVV